MGALSPTHWLIIVGVLVLLFGAKRLPDAARSLGRSARILKAEVKDMNTDTTPNTGSDTSAAVSPTALPPVQPVTAAEAPTPGTSPAAATPATHTPADRDTTGTAANTHPGR